MDIFGGLGSLASGVLNFFGQRDANAKNAAIARDTNAQNWANSQYMASNSIQLRKADAEKAGIHPLYAMGAPTMSFAPATVGAPQQNAMSGLASGLRDMGQDVSRAATAVQSPGQKVASVMSAQQAASNTLDLENKRINNEILKLRLIQMSQPGTPPGVPFQVPEETKVEKNPALMLGGRRWGQTSDTSPMKPFEDRYGDEGPVASMLPLYILDQDMQKNFGSAQTWPAQIGRWAMKQITDEIFEEGRNAKSFLSQYWNKNHPLPLRPTYRPTRLP